MARRRRFGSGLQQASAANAQFLEILLRAQQAKKAREEEDRLQRERAQMEHSLTTQRIREQGEQSVLTQIAQNPKFASLLVRAGRPKMGDLDLTKLQPTGEELAGPLFEDIGNATTPEAIPTGTELLGRFRGEGGAEDPHFKGPFPTVMGKEQVALPTAEVNTPIAQLMRARQAKEAQVMGEIQRKVKEQPRYSASGPFAGAQIAGPDFDPTQITATPGQLGANKATELVTGEFSPRVTRAKAGQAGAISGAQETAQIRARYQLRGLIAETEKEIAAARAAGKPISTKTSGVTVQLGQRMVELATKLNNKTWGPAATGQGIRDRLEAAARLDPDARELMQLRNGFVPNFARLIGHTGVLTQQDVDSTKNLLPGLGETVEGNMRVTNNFLMILQAAQTIGDQLGATEDSAEFQRRLQAAIRAAQGGAIEFEVGPDGVMRVK